MGDRLPPLRFHGGAFCFREQRKKGYKKSVQKKLAIAKVLTLISSLNATKQAYTEGVIHAKQIINTQNRCIKRGFRPLYLYVKTIQLCDNQ